MSYNVKQVLVYRKDLKSRRGKEAAQLAHASASVILQHLPRILWYKILAKMRIDVPSSAMFQWVNGSFAKICVYCKDEAELLAIYQKAKSAGLPCSLITDAGVTEFNGVPTNTAIAVGPCWSHELNGITDRLSLM
jgi:PTH2 family peptidyl-tRNA hydrolase